MNSLSHYNLAHTFIPMPQAIKIPEAKAAVEKEWEKLEKIPAWQLTKVRNRKEVIAEARKEGKTVHFASLMDICHLENLELEPEFQKYTGRVALRGDIVKDDSGSYAAFTEQGSPASQMTAENVMDVTSRLPGCAGQAADAISAYTQVNMEDAPSLLKNPKSECPDIWIRLPKHKWPNHGPERKTQSFLLSDICTVILQQDLYEKDKSRKRALEKVPNWECELANREKGLFSSDVDDFKLAGKKQNIDPMENTFERRLFGRTDIIP